MKSKLSVIIILIYTFAKTDSTTVSSLNNLIELVVHGGIPFKSVYLNSTPMTYMTPLRFITPLKSERIITITGGAIRIFPVVTSVMSTLTGGVLKENFYIEQDTVIAFKSNSSTDPCRLPITMYTIFTNIKYPSDDAPQEKDGVVILINRAKEIGSFDNPKAIDFVMEMQKLRQQSEIETKASRIFRWFVIISRAFSYFYYLRTFINLNTNSINFIGILELAPDIQTYLSKKQLNMVRNVTNKNGKSPNTTSAWIDEGPVIQATKIVHKLIQSE